MGPSIRTMTSPASTTGLLTVMDRPTIETVSITGTEIEVICTTVRAHTSIHISGPEESLIFSIFSLQTLVTVAVKAATWDLLAAWGWMDLQGVLEVPVFTDLLAVAAHAVALPVEAHPPNRVGILCVASAGLRIGASSFTRAKEQ